MELDVYLPKEKLAFEYQGQHHYNDIYAMGQQWHQKQTDKEKRRACEAEGITLIEIPYWWNQDKGSLMATIHKYRSDLCAKPENEEPIPKEPPQGFSKGLFLISF